MEGVDGTIGLLTTNSSKEVMCVAVQDLLSQERLHVSTEMLSISQTPREIYEQLLSELRAFMIYVDPPKTLFAKVRHCHHIKLHIFPLLELYACIRSRVVHLPGKWADIKTT